MPFGIRSRLRAHAAAHAARKKNRAARPSRVRRAIRRTKSAAARFLDYFHRMDHPQKGHYPTAQIDLVDNNGHSLGHFKGPLNAKGRANLEAAVEKAAKFPKGTLHTLFAGPAPKKK